MDVVLLQPPSLPKPHILCEAKLVHVTGWTEYWHDRKKEEAKRSGRDPYSCTRRAYVRIDGTPYCSVHCGPVLVAKLQCDKVTS